MRGMNRSILLAAAAHAAAYVTAASQHITRETAELIIGGAVVSTVKNMAASRTRDGRVTYVPSAKWVDRSKYWPHQGARECARRVRQMGA